MTYGEGGLGGSVANSPAPQGMVFVLAGRSPQLVVGRNFATELQHVTPVQEAEILARRTKVKPASFSDIAKVLGLLRPTVSAMWYRLARWGH